MVSNATGLLTAFTDPKGSDYTYTYNEYGHVTDAYDPAGGHWQYEQQRTTQGLLTSVLSAEGQQTTYLDRNAAGALESTITTPDGGVTEYWRSQDELHVHKELSCGTILDVDYALDPEYNQPYVARRVASTESGLASVTESAVTYLDEDGDSTYDLIQRITSLNGKPTTIEDDVAAGAVTVTTPEGRSSTQYYDPATLLPQRATVPGLLETTYGYDARGRLTSVATGERSLSYAYDDRGNLASVTDAQSRTTSYSYDADGRVTSTTRPDGSTINFTWDLNGNLEVLTVPSNVEHDFGYNKVDKNTSYVPPISSSYQYEYDRDRRLVRTVFPSGANIENVYDGSQLQQIITPEGNVDFTYLCSSKIGSISQGDAFLSFEYDGPLLTALDQGGELNAHFAFGYNDTMELVSIVYAGGENALAYDDDRLLIQSGDFSIERAEQNGLPLAVDDGTAHIARVFNGYGEVERQTLTVNGIAIGDIALTRDNVGRITAKTETIGAETFAYAYAYDAFGRLTEVQLNGAVVEAYTYGPQGERLTETNTRRGISNRNYTYDAEDHLLTAGTASYVYNPDGYLTSKTDANGTTNYTYASRGELKRVELPSGDVVEYRHDPLGRRVAKYLNGELIEKYLWLGRTRLLATYAPDGSLKCRFEYADGRLPVAMTSSGERFYLAYDQVGSLRAVTDANGAVVKTVSYDSFGNVLEDSNPALELPFGFAGGLYDAGTGLVRFGFRDYDAEVGRWTAKDPIGFGGGVSNLYSYSLSCPISYFDTIGLRESNLGASASFSFALGIKGTEISKGEEHDTLSILSFVGASVNISIGDMPNECDIVSELGVGLGRWLGIGYYFFEEEEGGDLTGGLVIHIGVGLGTPVSISTTFPDKSKCDVNCDVGWF